MRIDSHQHFWLRSRGDYGWLTPDSGVIYRDFLPEDLRPMLRSLGVDKTILVQAAPTVAEAEYMLGLADQEDFIAGVVGWLDMEADDFGEQLLRMRRHPKLVGIRPMIHDIPDDAWMLRPAVKRSFGILESEGFSIDFCSFPRHLPYILQVLDGFPKLRAVIDHISKPLIKDHQLAPWNDLIARVAAHENVVCKLSGMVTEADWASWTPDDLSPYVDHVFKAFGPDRLMFGSDWPVCLLAGSYEDVYNVLRQVLGEILGDGLTEEVDAAIFGGTAARFYGAAAGTKS